MHYLLDFYEWIWMVGLQIEHLLQFIPWKCFDNL
jgi:hypothetical protein